ncbi:NAD(P)-dependent oxidoreductase [Herbidospora sp. RD11066]
MIGLGAMGLPITRHLLAAGVRVAVHDLDPAAVREAAALGARPADSPADAARGAAVVAVFVPTDQDVLNVCLGERGVLAGIERGMSAPTGENIVAPDQATPAHAARDQAALRRRGAESGPVVLLCSSVRPETCVHVAQAAPPGVDVLDAALTGGVRGAEAGAINLLVGGDVEVLERVRPLLAPWTAAVHHLGPLGAGQVGKTANNLVHWAQICAVTEALELARRAGVDVEVLRRALLDGPVASRTLRELEYMRLTWHAKDLANAARLAAEVGMEIPVAETARRVMAGIGPADVARLLANGPLNRPVTLE